MPNISHRRFTASLALALAPLGAGLAPVANAAFDLTGINYVQYGDAQSYSLPIACIQKEQAYSGCDYNVDSTPGAIKDLVVIYTGSSGAGVTTNFAGMDDAYHTPSGGKTPSNYFQTGGLTFGGETYGTEDPNGTGEFAGDQANTWDTTLGALNTFLGEGNTPLFFFNNNQVKNLGTAGETLSAWMQVSVEWVDPTTGDTEIRYFDLTNDGGKYALVSEGGGGTVNGDVTTYTSTGAGPAGGTNDSTDYVVSGGALCVIGTPPEPVPCSTPGSTGPINHNLGADHAAYAIIFPELNALLAELTAAGLLDAVMHVDLRLGCDPTLFGTDPGATICNGADIGWGKNLNNGYEQLFLASMANVPPPPPPMPTPGSVGLIAGGLLTIAALVRRKGVAAKG